MPHRATAVESQRSVPAKQKVAEDLFFWVSEKNLLR